MIFHNHLNTNISSSFINIGLKSLSVCLGGVTLGMGETFADFHRYGMCPDLVELFNMADTGPFNTSAKLHHTQLGRPSGPNNFCHFMAMSAF